MIKKAVLLVVATMLIAFGAGIAYANQVDGMVSGAVGTPALPITLQKSVNPGGTGDALIYGYYNARDAFNFIRVVNTSETTAVKARVRFREGKRSKEILDFNICLSNKDEWSAWVMSPSADGPAMIIPNDTDTKTAPTIPASGQKFIYSSSGLTGLSDVTAADTQEGYFEIITTNTKSGGTSSNHIEFTDDECTNAFTLNGTSNVLAGNMFMLTWNGAYSYNAAAIENCSVIKDWDLQNEQPSFSDCSGGLGPVDYALTKQSHVAMYNVGQPGGETEVVLTFPTKWLHWDGLSVLSDGRYGYLKPFDTVSLTHCEPVDLKKYDDQENTPTTTTGFSPSGSQGFELCNEVNVIRIGNSSITNTNLGAQILVDDLGTDTGLGWIRLGLDTGTINCGEGNSTCLDGVHTYGLPSLGLVLQNHLGWEAGADSTMYNTSIGASTSN